jgi:hypothetical protein
VHEIPLDEGEILMNLTSVTSEHRSGRKISNLHCTDLATGARSPKVLIDDISLKCARSGNGKVLAVHLINFENFAELRLVHASSATETILAELVDGAEPNMRDVNALR